MDSSLQHTKIIDLLDLADILLPRHVRSFPPGGRMPAFVSKALGPGALIRGIRKISPWPFPRRS